MGTTKEESAEIGRGSRRVCTRIPGTNLCLKRYRDDDEVGATVRREIARGRFDRRLNTCAQEYDYLQELKRILPSDVLSVFPERVESALEGYEPSYIARYLLDLAAAYNRFYHNSGPSREPSSSPPHS